MNLKGWIFLLLPAVPFFAAAQNDFGAGTIVLNNGDTLSMLIKKINGRIAPEFIQCKTTASPELRLLSAAEVKWFHYNEGEWYFGYTGFIENSSLNDNYLTHDSAMHSVPDSMFIRAVIISQASLFYGRDHNDRIHLFYSKNGGKITELLYKKYVVDEVVVADYRNKITKRAIMANEVYKGQLIHALADCPSVSSGILSRGINYSKNDLLKLFEDYNQCRDAKITYTEDRDKGKVEFSFLGGINYTGLKFRSSYAQWAAVNFDHGLGWEAGIGLNWFFPHLENKFSINNELLLKEHSLQGRVGESTTQTAEYKALYAKLIIMGRYSVPKGSVRLFFEAGLSNGFALSHTLTTSDGTIKTMFRDYRNYEQGIILTGGLTLKNMSVELRLEKSNGFSSYSDLSSTFTTWYLQLAYTL